MRIPFVPNTLKLLIVLILILFGSMAYAGHVRTSFLPFPALNVEKSWLMVGTRLGGLKYDRAACEATLKSPVVQKNIC